MGAGRSTGSLVSGDARVAVVIITRNRRESLLTSLAHLTALPETPRIVVVDNGSSDGTLEAVASAYPGVATIALDTNEGSAARNRGVRLAGTPYVAFADDDSWWAPGALTRAADLLDAHPRLAVVAARMLVGPEERLDPVCELMAASPLTQQVGVPGSAVLGFVACGAVVRASAVLEAGGFHRHFGVGGEEELLTLDLAAAGWALTYADAVVAHHHPSPARDPAGRRRIQARNALWCAWLRRPLPVAAARTLRLASGAAGDSTARDALMDAVRGLPWVLRERRRLPVQVEQAIRMLESGVTGHAADAPAPASATAQRHEVAP